jgi:hypothetical protein
MYHLHLQGLRVSHPNFTSKQASRALKYQRTSTELNIVKSQKIELFIGTTGRTANPTKASSAASPHILK